MSIYVTTNKIVFWVVLILSSHTIASSQLNSDPLPRRYYGIAAGMGVMLISAPDIVDYINTGYPTSTKLDDFSPGAEFFGETNIQISNSWNIKIEYIYLIKSYNIPQQHFPDYAFTYEIHMPALIAQYMIPGENYLFKFGGGMGYNLASFSQTIMNNNTRYRSEGLGVKIVTEGNTAFDDNLFGYICGEIHNNFMDEFKDSNNKKIIILGNGKAATMNSFGLGLKFGVCYFF